MGYACRHIGMIHVVPGTDGISFTKAKLNRKQYFIVRLIGNYQEYAQLQYT